MSFVLLILTVFVSSCKKEDSIGKGKAMLKVSLMGVDFSNGASSPLRASAASINGKVMAIEAVQQVTLPFSDKLELVASLIPDLSNIRDSEIVASAVKGAGMSPMAVGPVTNQLPNGTAYEMVIYDAAGAYWSTQTYHVGSESSVAAIELNAGEEYTFVIYSNGTSTSDYFTTIGTDLDTDRIATPTGAPLNQVRMMVSKITKQLTPGENKLDVVLKHQFSQITTEIDASAVGNITAASATITPHNGKATFIFKDESLVFENPIAIGAPVIFSALNTNVITSEPTIVWANTQTGEYTLNITIGGVVKEFTLGNLKITPGVRYNLKLTVQPSAGGGIDGIELGGSEWAPGNLVYNNGEYGFAATQFEYGDMWYWNWLTPAGVGTAPGHSPQFNAALDPCTKVEGGGWRTPSKAEYQALLNLGTLTSVHHAPYAPGRIGVFLGRTTVPANDNVPYVFLPARPVGTGDFFYWINSAPSLDNGDAYLIGNGGYSHQWSNTDDTVPYPIRCVKNK